MESWEGVRQRNPCRYVETSIAPWPRQAPGVIRSRSAEARADRPAPGRRPVSRGRRGTGDQRSERLVDDLRELRLADRADLRGLHLTVLEQQQHRDRAHVVLQG